MRKLNFYFILFTVSLFVTFPAIGECDCTKESITRVPQSECEALKALYISAVGDNWLFPYGSTHTLTHVYGWTTTSPVEGWYGVTVEEGHVTEIDLDGSYMEGTIPPDLEDLVFLRKLDFNDNNLGGNIPAELGNLGNLEFLGLYRNDLTGQIPAEIGNLTRLEKFWCPKNNLTGHIPADLGNLTNLKDLDLRQNYLSGSIPSELGNLINLEELNLTHNQLTGSIPPELGDLENLIKLNLGNNHLDGQIPPEIGDLTGLRSLFLWRNQLEGLIPDQIRNLVYLNGSDSSWGPHYSSSVAYNALFTENSNVNLFMNQKFQKWNLTQTIPPTQIKSEAMDHLNQEEQLSKSNWTRFSWESIPYQENDGGYEICLLEYPDGPCIASAGITADKEESTLVVSGLNPDSEYFINLISRTYLHEENPNTNTSHPSETLSIHTGPVAVTAFPIWKMEQGSFTGIAFSNYGSEQANITLSAYDEDGHRLTIPVNPAQVNVEPGKQKARLGTELFEVTEISEQLSWVEAASDQLLGTFFTFGSSDMRMLDGAVTQSRPSRRVYFTRPTAAGTLGENNEAGEVNIILINPLDQNTELTLYLKQGGELVDLRSQNISAKGMILTTAEKLFGTESLINDGYIEVKTKIGGGIIGFSRVDFPETGTTLALNAAEPSSAETLYSAQLASGPGAGGSGMETHIRLVNPMENPREVTFTAIAEDGTLLAEPVTQILGGQTAAEFRAWDLFEFVGTSAVGSLVIEADAGGIVGDVIFTPFEGIEYAAAMPLQTRPVKEAVFNHIANSEEIYTGLAFFNPGEETAEITIIAKRGDGTEAGTRQITLAPGHRISRTLHDPDMLPGTASQLDGFISISSTQPIICQQLFGSTDLRFLAAVPPTTSYTGMF
jgi:Leucine Rich repeats (2 copies)/Leucine Rich Repeat